MTPQITVEAPAQPERPSWWAVVGVMLIAILDVLDMTVVNISLPHMIGSFSATPDQITWVLTAYMVSTAIVMPLTGYLTDRFGRRQVLLIAITGFVATSMLCGFAWNLSAMVLFRFFQGAFGAVLVPISQSVLLEAFPREKRGQAMAIWGLAIMVAPVIGPVIGGWITEHLSWRWVFYINLPLGGIALLLAIDQLRKTPHRSNVVTDWLGLALLAVGLGSMQIIFDQGHTRDWFDSSFIWILTWLGVSASVIFFARARGIKHPIVDLSLFADRNFAIGNVLMAVFAFGMYSVVVLVPIFVQNLLNYPADTAGLVFAPRGLVSAVAMIFIAAYIARRVDSRWLIAIGIGFSCSSTLMMTEFSLQVDMRGLIIPGIIQGFGMALIFGQLAVITFDTIPAHKADAATGLYNVTRTIGGALGVAVSSTLLVRQEQVHWHNLVGNVSAYDPQLRQWLSAQQLNIHDSETMARLSAEILIQARMGAFIDIFWFVSCIFLILLPLVFFLAKPTHGHVTG